MALIVAGIMRRPGIGIILALLIIAALSWFRINALNQMGLRQQSNWLETLSWAVSLSTAIAFLALGLIEPGAEHLTGEPHDIGIVDGVRDDPKSLIYWLLLIWIFVALIEEVIFRGFLMSELSRILPVNLWGLIANLMMSSVDPFVHKSLPNDQARHYQAGEIVATFPR